MTESEACKVKWGEIYYCNLGPPKDRCQAGIRPVVVVQNNVGNANCPTTVIVPISTSLKKLYLPTHILLDPSCGLREKSVAMLEQIRTVDKTEDLLEYVGKINDKATIDAIKRGIAIEMGLIECPKPQKKLVLALCPKCRSSYLSIPGNMIRRVDYLQSERETCDMCQKAFGFDYYIKKRTTSHAGMKGLLSHK